MKRFPADFRLPTSAPSASLTAWPLIDTDSLDLPTTAAAKMKSVDLSASRLARLKPPYRLVVVDMDGTYLNSAGQISERNHKLASTLQQRGVHFVIATGAGNESAANISCRAESPTQSIGDALSCSSRPVAHSLHCWGLATVSGEK